MKKRRQSVVYSVQYTVLCYFLFFVTFYTLLFTLSLLFLLLSCPIRQIVDDVIRVVGAKKMSSFLLGLIGPSAGMWGSSEGAFRERGLNTFLQHISGSISLFFILFYSFLLLVAISARLYRYSHILTIYGINIESPQNRTVHTYFPYPNVCTEVPIVFQAP